jgi:hypothetical protein
LGLARNQGRAMMTVAKDGSPGGGVYFEFTPIGTSVKVVAIDAATGIEVSVIGPARASQADLQQLALQKLRLRLKADR